MSRVRFGEDGSDIYLYDDIGGYINCCLCALAAPAWNTTLHSVDEALAHIAAHRAAGQHVPDYVDADLETERDDLTKWLSRAR